MKTKESVRLLIDADKVKELKKIAIDLEMDKKGKIDSDVLGGLVSELLNHYQRNTVGTVNV
ncbi:MAG: hypothetical protein AB7D43_13155 [Sulfurimonadaceae bacterium]